MKLPFRHLAAGAAIIAVMTLTAYIPALRGGFVWDDDDYVTHNRCLQDAGGLARIWLAPGAVSQYYPLTYTSFWLDWRLWGANPLPYHVHNVLLHAASAMLLWLLLRRLGVPGAMPAACVFALHPVNVESAGWITERKNVLSLLLYLASALAYFKFTPPEDDPVPAPAGQRGPRATFGRRWGFYALAVGLFILALLAKTVACSLPAAILVALWWKRRRLAWRDVWPLAPMLAIGAAMACVTAWMESVHVRAEDVAWTLPPLGRVLVAGRALWFYAGKLLAPWPLVFVYPRWEIDVGAWWQWVFPIAAAAVIAALWLLRGRTGKGPLAAVLIFAGTLVPALGFFKVYYQVQYSYVADHFQYHASIALIALGAALATAAIRRLAGPRARQVGIAVAAVVLAALGTLTWAQCGIYTNLETLWRDTLRHNPRCWLALNNLGALLTDQAMDTSAAPEARRKLLAEAMERCRKSLEVRPDNARAHNNIGNALVLMAELQPAPTTQSVSQAFDQAVKEYADALRLEPSNAGIHNNLGKAYVRMAALSRDFGDAETARARTDLAVAEFRRAAGLQKDFADPHNNLALVLRQRGRPDEAREEFALAIAADPRNFDAHKGLADLLSVEGKAAEAISHYAAALAVNPASAEAHNNMGVALESAGRPGEAIQHYTAALRINPAYADAQRNLRAAQAGRGGR
ncbi:MAG: tetratricopeptide repeat protein [Phycisphaerae bacterium]